MYDSTSKWSQHKYFAFGEGCKNFGGNLIVPGKISASATPPEYIAAGEYPTVIYPSVQLFAHNSITVGSISNPSGMIFIRAGGNLEDGLLKAGTNPANIVVTGVVDVTPNSGPFGGPKNGCILIDNGGGNISTANLLGAGGRFVVSAPGKFRYRWSYNLVES